MMKRTTKALLRQRRKLSFTKDPIVKDLHSPKYYQRIVKDKTQYNRKEKYSVILEQEW